MHKYEQLEKLYYKKKYTQYALFLFSFIVIITISGYFVFKSDKKIESNNTIEVKKTQKPAKIEKNITKIVKKEKNITEKNKTIVFNKIIKEKEIKKLVLYPIFPEITPKTNTNLDTKDSQQILKKEVKNSQKSTLKIEVKSINNTKDLIYLFDKSPNYKSAMNIAKYYFTRKKYQKAIKWVKKANEINPEDYESWYIFAKTLIKLGKVNKAKQVLIAYLNTYGPDKNIEELLRSIK